MQVVYCVSEGKGATPTVASCRAQLSKSHYIILGSLHAASMQTASFNTVLRVDCCCGRQVMSKIREYVTDINANPNALAHGQRGPYSKYELPDEALKGRVDLKFFDNVGKGVSELA